MMSALRSTGRLTRLYKFRFTERPMPQIPIQLTDRCYSSPVGLGSASNTGLNKESEYNILKESIRSTIEQSPELAANAPGKTSQSTLPLGNEQKISTPSTDYGKLKLSHENLIVDTHAMIKAYKIQGFSTEQAEIITYSFTQLLNDALREQRKLCVEKAALDIMREQIMAHIGSLRKDMTILEKSELSDLRNENEKLKLLLSQTKSQITEDVGRVKNQLTLDINMERSRAKEDFTQSEKNIAKLTTKMTEELGKLETTFERYKNDIYKFIAGTIASVMTIGLGIYRIWKS